VAINKDTPHHAKARKWLKHCLSSDEPFGFAWIVILGFLRIVTNGRIMPTRLAPEVAFETVDDWLQHPPSVTIVPLQQHWPIFKEILMPLGTAPNLTSDAHPAALAIGLHIHEPRQHCYASATGLVLHHNVPASIFFYLGCDNSPQRVCGPSSTKSDLKFNRSFGRLIFG
jgi:toxin-antitoxin system PIN domain toxin